MSSVDDTLDDILNLDDLILRFFEGWGRSETLLIFINLTIYNQKASK